MNTLDKQQPFVLPHIAKLAPYVPGLQCNEREWAKLNTNEAPYPPSPKVVAAIRQELGETGRILRRYSEPTSQKLRAAIAGYHKVRSECVIAGNGADDVLNMLCRVYASEQQSVGMTTPSYSLYKTLSSIQGASLVNYDFDDGFKLPIEAIAKSEDSLFFLTNPNAPSGVAISTKEIAQLAKRYTGILVVDETYAPFAEQDCVELLAECPRLVLIRSFSKAFALAGLRIGYGIASAGVIDMLDRVRDSYNLDCLAQAGALAAVEDVPYYSEQVALLKERRSQIAERYRAYGWQVYDSSTNFHLVEPKAANGETGAKVAQELYEYLRAGNVLVRYFANHRLTAARLRISIGDVNEMDRLFKVIDKWLKKN